MSTDTAAPFPTQTVDERVGEMTRFWMYRRGVNQPELGRALGLSRQSISRKIAGKVTWSVTELAKTAALLEVPITELMPEDTVEIATNPPSLSDDGSLVAGAGFEPTTSGL